MSTVNSIDSPDTLNSGAPVYFTLATAGHVDHGKTSVLRRLTGIDPDRLKEEKLRQMTTDLGFAHLSLRSPQEGDGSELIVGFIDVPGHGKFLKNMLAGVGGIHLALLVVAADEGPMPQTVSHVKILSLLGVRRAIVVMTKTDLADAKRQDDVAGKIEKLLSAHEIELLSLVRVSCTQEKGFDELKKTLADVLGGLLRSGNRSAGMSTGAGGNESSAGVAEAAYVPIDRVFSKSGYGVVITGTIVRGTLSVGDSVNIEPGGIKGRVRGLETFGLSLQKARAGQRLAVNLSLKEHKSLARGQTLLGAPHALSKTLIVKLDQSGEPRDRIDWPSLEGQMVRLYHGTAECFGHLRWTDKELLERGSAIAQISLQVPTIAEPGDRFVLRFGDEGITGGVVLLTARPRWLTRPRVVALARELACNQYDVALKEYLEANPQKMAKESGLSCLLPLSVIKEVSARSIEAGSVKRTGDFMLTTDSDKHLKETILAAVQKHEQSHAGDAASDRLLSIESIRTETMPHIDRHVFQSLVKELIESGSLRRDGDKLSLPQKQISSTEADGRQSEMAEKIVAILGEHLCLEIAEIARLTGCDVKTATAALNKLSRDNKARLVNYEYASLVETLNEAHRKLAKIWQAKREISPSDFRDELQTTRKYALAILAYFDDQSVTRRMQNSRVLLKSPPAKE